MGDLRAAIDGERLAEVAAALRRGGSPRSGYFVYWLIRPWT